MVKPPEIVKVYVDTSTDILYADVGMPDLQEVGFILSSGTVVDGALVHSSLISLDGDDHLQYSLVGGSRAFSGNIATTASVPISGSHLTRKDYVDSAVSAGAVGVASLNTLTGTVTMTGAGETNITVVGNIITVSGTDHTAGGGSVSKPLVGVDGITVTSGVSFDTATGFRTEFVNASGSLSTEIDSDIAAHTLVSDAHHSRYSQDENLAITGSDGISIVSGSNTIDIGGFLAEFLSASGTLSTQITDDIATHDAITNAHHDKYTDAEAVTATESARFTMSGTLSAEIDTDISTHATVSDAHHTRYSQAENSAITGSDGITIISGSSTINVGGFQTEFVNASGSLQTQINVPKVDSLNSLTGNVIVSGKGEVAVTVEGQLVVVSGASTRLISTTVVDVPGDDEDVSIMRATQDFTIDTLFSVVRGAGSPSVTWTVRHDSSRSAIGTEVVTAGTTTTNTTVGEITTTMNNPTITGGSWVWLETVATGSNPQELMVEIFA